MLFPCPACGECCRHIKNIPQLQHLDRGDGVCIHLKENLCEIYKDRPEVCNSEKMYKKFFSDFSEKDFFDFNHKICRKLISESTYLSTQEKAAFLDKLCNKI